MKRTGAAGIGVCQPLQSRCAAAEQRHRMAAARVAEHQVGDIARREARDAAATCWAKHSGSVSQSGVLETMRLGPPRRPTRVVDLLNPAAVLLPAANVIMQLASPAVGYGVLESPVDSGNVYKHPFKRARTTGTYLAAATLGTDADRALIRAEVDKVHALVRSNASSPLSYNAFDPRLQLWVAACLYRYYIDQHEFLYGPLDDDAADAVYEDARKLGTTLQVRDECGRPTASRSTTSGSGRWTNFASTRRCANTCTESPRWPSCLRRCGCWPAASICSPRPGFCPRSSARTCSCRGPQASNGGSSGC